MRLSHSKLAVVLLLCASAHAQEPALATNAPKDKPTAVASREKFERDIAPYVARAKSTYPQAKARFLQGLPKGQSFFVTTRLLGADGSFEQVFIAVQSIRDGQVMGRIWSDPHIVKAYKYRDAYSFPEDRLLDWLITKPDGSEEGNFVGNFLDTYKQ
ncbi:hypothetical protein ACG04R_12770 [Roseateles sp. BYS78W]|uniref:DUF2314 domain-containing protein n=1 Tax=Pelomonas candidula TaxID=3299025 RepID=A0ABW7HD18_9BURK